MTTSNPWPLSPRPRIRPVRESRAAAPQVERTHRAPAGTGRRPVQGWPAGAHTTPARACHPPASPGRTLRPAAARTVPRTAAAGPPPRRLSPVTFAAGRAQVRSLP